MIKANTYIFYLKYKLQDILQKSQLVYKYLRKIVFILLPLKVTFSYYGYRTNKSNFLA